MRSNRVGRGSWRVGLLVVVVGFGTATWSSAQSSCTPLSAQACVPTFGDATTFTLPTCYARDVVQAGIMLGCGGNRFCPQAVVTRADMAVFLENAKHRNDLPPKTAFLPAIGVFGDVPKSFPLACWIEQFGRDGITAGCGGGNYCPDSPVTRGQMAVFILKTMAVVPPTCTNPPIFNDVPCTYLFADWINELYNECIAAGCGNNNYCPEDPITREAMAVFLWKAFLRPACGRRPACAGCVDCS